MCCQACGERPARRYVAFYQNIGLLVLRLSSSVKGDLCTGCIHQHFWQTTAINLVLGWWGIISFVVTPFFIINNILYYAGLLGTQSPNGTDWSARAEPPRPSGRSAGSHRECYLCGKPLEQEDGQARVCQACRS